MQSAGPHNLEQRVSRIWQDVLGIEDVPLDTHFFDAGGDSLRFVVLLTRVNQLVGRDVDPAELFRCTTVRAQADLLARL